MENNAYHIFTHNDLDGAVSLLVFLWMHPNDSIAYTEVSNLEIDKIKNYVFRLLTNQNIYILDLSLREEFLPVLDSSCITFIDHHEKSTHISNRFTKSKIVTEPYSSNCLLTRKHFAYKNIILTNEQKKLILLADDYDSGNFKYEDSYNLNILFWTFYKNNFTKFINDYRNGFFGFTAEQKKQIFEIKQNALLQTQKLKKFIGELNIKNNKKKTIGILVDSFNNLVFDYFIKNNPSELYFFINTKSNKVKIKQSKSENMIDLDKFASKFCNGSGNNQSAIGTITPIFMELTKNLKPL